MPSGWDTVCLTSGFGVPTMDQSGCSSVYTFEGELRQQVDSYSWMLSDAREAVIGGRSAEWAPNGPRTPPYAIAADMTSAAKTWCENYPGTCPADPIALANKYIAILADVVSQYGFDMQGNYSGKLDNQVSDGLFPEGITTTPAQTNPNIVNYSPSAGWRPPLDSLPVTLSPTIPAYTSPSNVAATSPGSPYASGGGTDVAGTASGAGASQGGSNTQQTSLTPSSAGAVQVSMLGGMNNQKLLVILLVIAVAVIFFGRE